MKTPDHRSSEALPHRKPLEAAVLTAHESSKIEPRRRLQDRKELLLGLVLIICLVMLEGVAVTTFLDRLAYGNVREPVGVVWVEPAHGF